MAEWENELTEAWNRNGDTGISSILQFARSGTTACVTCVWAGVDSVWEQEKLEARKMLENAAESHTSGARFVGWRFVARHSL